MTENPKPPATEGETQLVARITAMELLIRHLLALVAATTRKPVEHLDEWRQKFHDELSTSYVVNRDAAMSDHLMEEVTKRVDVLFAAAISDLAELQNDRN